MSKKFCANVEYVYGKDRLDINLLVSGVMIATSNKTNNSPGMNFLSEKAIDKFVEGICNQDPIKQVMVEYSSEDSGHGYKYLPIISKNRVVRCRF